MALYKQIQLPFGIKKNITDYLSLSKNMIEDIEGYHSIINHIKFITDDDLNILIKKYISRSEPHTMYDVIRRWNGYNTNIKKIKEELYRPYTIYVFIDKIINSNNPFKLIFSMLNNAERDAFVVLSLRNEEEKQEKYSQISLLDKIISNGDIKMIYYYTGWKNINYQDHFGWTILHYAAHNGNSKMVDKILDMKANKYVLNSEGNTPIDCAYLNNHQNIVKLMKFK